MYLIHGMRNAGIDVDSRLESIGIKADALDPSSIIHPSLEWDIQMWVCHSINRFYT